jgi:uncharacterized membrane protein YgcG
VNAVGRVTGIGLAVVLLLGVVGVSIALANDLDNFSFESFDARYEVSQSDDGSSFLETTETLIPVFPDFDQNRGLARYLATRYLDRPLNTTVTDVTDESGSSRPWSVITEGEALVVESVVPPGQYVRGRQVYVLHYTQENVIGDFTSTTGIQEFYWNVNGVGWPQRFERVTAEVVIPANLAGSLTSSGESCYFGYEGDTNRCDIVRESQPDGSVRFLAEAGPLLPYQTMTIAVGFAPDTFVVPAAQPFSIAGLVSQTLALLGALASLIWSMVLRRGPLADAPGRPVIVPEYIPPKTASVTQALVLRGSSERVPLANILALAVANKVALSQDPEHRRKWSLIRRNTPLTPDDEAVLTVLFGQVPAPEETVPLPRQSTSVASRLTDYVSAQRAQMKTEGFYQKVPFSTRLGPFVLAGGSGLLALWGVMLGDSASGEWLHWLAGFGGLAVVAWAGKRLARTPLGPAGSELRDYLEGLKVYIRLAEKDRLAYLQSPDGALREKVSPDNPKEVLNLYERILPWAVVVGEEKRWMAELDKLYRDQDPTWIRGTTPGLANSLSSFSQATQSSFRSSSSGGTSGGGSAGGGGGGGGGGGR